LVDQKISFIASHAEKPMEKIEEENTNEVLNDLTNKDNNSILAMPERTEVLSYSDDKSHG